MVKDQQIVRERWNKPYEWDVKRRRRKERKSKREGDVSALYRVDIKCLV